jgi:hypothetical protein
VWFRGGLVLGRGIDLVVSLREGSGDKTALSKSLCDRLLSEKDKGLATSLSLSVLRAAQVKEPSLKTIMDGGDFMTRVSVHDLRDNVDSPENTSGMTCFVSLGVSFIQDYKSYDESLDDRIACAVVESLNDYNLDLVFTDVTVNKTQYVNGVEAEEISLDEIEGRVSEEPSESC